MIEITKGIAVQIAAGVAVVLLVYLLSMWIMQRDQILDHEIAYMRPTSLRVDILRGFGNMTLLADKQWSTMNQVSTSFLPLLKSYNRRGGLQFSYAFWVKIDTRSGASELAGQTMLLRGDRRLFKWRKTVKGDPKRGILGTSRDNGPDVLVKCPHIRFGKSYDELVVEFNTLNDPSVSYSITPKSGGTPGDVGDRRNALSLMQGKWALLTFAFEDNVGISNFEDGIMVRFYINDSLYHTHRQTGSFKHNQGDLYVAPNFDRAINNLTIGDIRYYNYAVPPKEVADVYKDGPPTKPADELQQRGSSDPLYLSEYNKLDIYNN